MLRVAAVVPLTCYRISSESVILQLPPLISTETVLLCMISGPNTRSTGVSQNARTLRSRSISRVHQRYNLASKKKDTHFVDNRQALNPRLSDYDAVPTIFPRALYSCGVPLRWPLFRITGIHTACGVPKYRPYFFFSGISSHFVSGTWSERGGPCTNFN